jgi:hypothetical protein
MLEFRQLVMNRRVDKYNSACNDLISMAELEFVRFTRAVTDMFGAAQATLAAEDWLNELASKDCMPEPMSQEWRLVTVAALARLTIRMTVALYSPNCNRRAN